jgi:3-hydroxyisobutyrate dehydrogenase
MVQNAGRLPVGVIGLGNMGRPIARRLLAAGYPLFVHDVAKENAREILDQGGCWGDTPAALCEEAGVVCTVLPGPAEANEVFFGSTGICHAARKGSIVIDFTTNSPLLVRRIEEALAERGAGLLDAPMSGGVEAARNGELTLIVGGKPETLNAARTLLTHLAKTVLHVGESGAGAICKALHNCAVFCANLATVECLTVGVKAGVDAATLIEVFQKSGLGRNLDLQVAMPATLFRGQFSPPRFAMKTARKDMGLATELAAALGVPMRLATICEQDMSEAIQRGWGNKDNTVFLTLQEERAGVEVRSGG